ncbi:MAG: DUF935 family protein [Candidatus Kapaibacterium sp.]|jgi:phage gp29-like protein|nr:DUF935 family protein [Candidatus Kapabacteria bacterium]
MNKLTGELIKSSNLYNFIRRVGILPVPERIIGRFGNSYRTLDELKNDPHVWSCIQSRKSGTLTLDTFIDTDGCSPEVGEFVKYVFERLDTNALISEVLDAILLGFQVHEIIWIHDDKRDSYLIPEMLKVRKQELFAFSHDGKLLYKNESKEGFLVVPEFKFLVSSFEANATNPYGSGLLSKIYWFVTFKNSAVRFWVNYMEKYGMPLIFGQINRGNSQQDAERLAESLVEMTDNTVIIAPDDVKIEMKEAARNSSSELFGDLINYCNAEISKSILSETLTTELHSGSYAAAQTHFKIRKEVICSDTRLAENTLNKLIEYIVKVNFGNVSNPKFRFVINDSDNVNKIDRDVKLASAGVRFTKEYWMKTYGLSESDFNY